MIFRCPPLEEMLTSTCMYLFLFHSGAAASRLPAGLQLVPPSRPVGVPPGAAPGEEISPPASVQRSPLPALPTGGRQLGPAG